MVKQREAPIDWVDTSISVQEKKPLSPEQPQYESPDDWYAKRFPIVVAAKEWQIDRSRTSILARKKKHSMVRIEIRRKSDRPLGIHGYRDLEEGSVLSNWSDLVMDGDVVVFNLLKRDTAEESSIAATNYGSVANSSRPESRGNGSVSTIGFTGPDDRIAFDLENPLTDKWYIKFSAPISKTSIKREKDHCFASLGNLKNSKKDEVTLHFTSEAEAKKFVQFVAQMKNIHNNVAKESIKSNMDTDSIISKNLQSIEYLIEIVSATDLKAVNRSTSDPFVVVKYGGETIHRTDVISKDLNPIWTIKTKSLFIFTLQSEEYYNNELLFEVRDFETFTANVVLGQALFTNEQLLKCKGERIEMKLKNLQSGVDTQGYLAIRCRRATEQDIQFFKSPYKNNSSVRINQNAYIEPLYSKQNPTFQIEKSKVIHGEKQYFVRPMNPDKDRQWMTKEQMDTACKERSINWTEAGSGTLGEVFVEVISCEELPNLDRGLPSNKTDAFVTLVCEDAIVTTEVIRDCLNPKFMPWTRRAFKFNVQHVT